MSLNPNPGSDEQSGAQSPQLSDVNTESRSPAADRRPGSSASGRAAASLDEELQPRLTTDLSEITIINDDFRDEDGDIADLSAAEMLQLVNTYEETLTDVAEGKILRGSVVEVRENEVLLNIGFKSEGVIPLDEFGGAPIKPGDEFDVFLEKLENQDGLVALSKERADFLKVWDKIKIAHENNDIVRGLVDRRIKGGLVVKLWGVDTFLPGSQVALRQVPNLEDLIGKEIECRIIKKNKRRRNVVVSRRIVLEQERESKKKSLIAELEKGQIRRGVVKNITDFGAFVDLGGIDGLLHITDLSWGRVQHPNEVVQIGDEIDVKVLDFEQERERISLGLKQLQAYPWEDVEKKYPEGSVVRGRVVSITNYGAFVELERGVEGLIHISEMSWTRHIKHPSKVLNIGEEVNVMVLKIDKENEKISLGLKQTEEDPWESLANSYPVGTIIEGKVRNLTDFGAFVEVEEGIDGLVHISDMSWTKRVRHPKEMLRKGDSVTVQILDIDTQKRRISLGIKQLVENPWPNLADEFPSGRTINGTVIRMLDHGLIVDLGNDLEGFVPIGHLGLAIPKQDKPQYYFREGEQLDLKVIKMDVENRRIVLSLSERLQDLGDDARTEFVAAHPRLDDVAAADEAGEHKNEILPGDEDLALEAADYDVERNADDRSDRVE
ncbi:MAG: 30S ribosomal protein S1 [Candidatus Krumholzibacteria bacterium]|jgi:small subunit ribosomal protein S1|nr:30S ribosomal protein S1 [Candidatus Krumholzibacteria bacterium]